jgi:acyl-CoA dehydrogenase
VAFDFTLTDRVRDWQRRIRDFVDRVVIPCEQRAFAEGLTDALRLELQALVGGHGRLRFDDVEVADDAVLGEAGQGFRYAQVRLAPARMTHCMRWLGAARRAHEIALDRSVRRTLFGAPLTEHGMAQQLIADNEIELAAARALLWQTCWFIAEGDRGTESSSRAKVFISEVVDRVVDRSVQLCGGMGVSQELVVGRIYADARAFRIYDGASEAHRMSIARRAARRAAALGTGER